MKRAFTLSVILFFFCFHNSVNAQTADIKNIVGFWTSDGSSTRLVFFFDKNDNLQLVEWDSRGGEEMEIVDIKITMDTVKTTERFKSTNYVTYNSYYLTNENTIGNIINGNATTTIYFRRIK